MKLWDWKCEKWKFRHVIVIVNNIIIISIFFITLIIRCNVVFSFFSFVFFLYLKLGLWLFQVNEFKTSMCTLRWLANELPIFSTALPWFIFIVPGQILISYRYNSLNLLLEIISISIYIEKLMSFSSKILRFQITLALSCSFNSIF